MLGPETFEAMTHVVRDYRLDSGGDVAYVRYTKHTPYLVQLALADDPSDDQLIHELIFLSEELKTFALNDFDAGKARLIHDCLQDALAAKGKERADDELYDYIDQMLEEAS